MRRSRTFPLVGLAVLIAAFFVLGGSWGCANIIPPTGGPKDTTAPVLVEAVPGDSALNFKERRIDLYFNEYVTLQNAFEEVVFSPMPVNRPIVESKLRNVNVRIKDTLEPNTTYSINFGNAIQDVNENNKAKNFTYVFSTGRRIDVNTLKGTVAMAQTGEIDSTLIVVLHRNLADTAVAKEPPRYMARLDGKGNFQFRFLAPGKYAVYALPNDYSKRYDDSTKPFAFADQPVTAGDTASIALYAYQLPKIDTAKPKVPDQGKNKKEDKAAKQLRFQTSMTGGQLSLLQPLIITFDKHITTIDSSKISLLKDSLPVKDFTFRNDSGSVRFIVNTNWTPQTSYLLVLDSTAFTDSLGGHLAKNDTIKFSTKRTEEYGSVRMRFRNINYSRNPVIQLVQNGKVVDSEPITERDFYRKLVDPGEYDLRILYDTNKNGIWDAGHFYDEHRQPEVVVKLNTKITVRANWDNEKDITL